MIKDVPDTRVLFGKITSLLIHLLESLTEEQWLVETCYPTWTVKDIVSHLLQTAIGRLSSQRDCFVHRKGSDSLSFQELSVLINQFNSSWNTTFSGISPQVILTLFKTVEPELAEFMRIQELYSDAFHSVVWAGESESYNIFDIAREYTERWHHQQQIREAVGAEPLTRPEFLKPVIDTLILAVPYWYSQVEFSENDSLLIRITGESGSSRLLYRSGDELKMELSDENENRNMVCLSDDTAWKFLTRSISKEQGRELITFSNMNKICSHFLNVKAIMIND